MNWKVLHIQNVFLFRYGLSNFPQVRNAGFWVQSREAGNRWVMHDYTRKSNQFCFVALWMYSFLPVGSDSLLDKIQKAAEVVASAVLPPTEHQGIRLHDNHYRPVAAPSAPIEVAVPACAYNLPACTPKGETFLVWWEHHWQAHTAMLLHPVLMFTVTPQTFMSSFQQWSSGAQGR